MENLTVGLNAQRQLASLTFRSVTEWRRNPTHQGGYLLDGGVHYVAGLRLLLGVEPGHHIASLSAFTTQIQPYLPPVDTADVILRTTLGVTGVFQISRGTSLRADEWTVACSHGWIKVENETVTISRDGRVEVVRIPNERTGVPPEIRAWGESLVVGRTHPDQEPEAALADLELVRNRFPVARHLLMPTRVDRAYATKWKPRWSSSCL